MSNPIAVKMNIQDSEISFTRKLSDFLLTYGFYLFFFILLIIGSIASPVFLTWDNLIQIVFGATSILVVAAGVTIVIITGEMDLSVGSVALTSMAIAVLAGKLGASFGVMLITALVIGLICGLINGFLVAFLKMNSMLTTLGMMIALRGFALQISNGGAQIPLQKAFKQFAVSRVFGISWIIIMSLIIMLILQIILRRSKFGAYCYAVGCNMTAAERTGLPVRRIKMVVFMISGICAAVAGIISCAKLGTYSRSIGQSMEFDVISVCVIGGTSLLGGRGKILPGTPCWCVNYLLNQQWIDFVRSVSVCISFCKRYSHFRCNVC